MHDIRLQGVQEGVFSGSHEIPVALTIITLEQDKQN